MEADPHARAQQGEQLTTATGLRVRDTNHSLKAGPRGPSLLQDHHFREKITHFDHERIPERVVHARGSAAHGVFTSYGTASSVTSAAFLAEGASTEVFVRFSTVLGSRGSADTVRDTRGFATKFYTTEGNFDLVANNIPVFFIQDAIKFPDVIHAGKPHPDVEIPQAQSAHDTFWDFVSLHTEAQHHTMWNMSGRGIPRSYRTMEGFGVHTFRLVNADGQTTLAKFHWRSKLGTHSLVWEEAQIAAGVDPAFHRRDLAEAIDAGAFPEYELGIQTFPDTPEATFEGIDLLDPTKIVPEELAPVQPVGKMVLNRNPKNFFAETEQVAFHVGHLVPGIDVTDDPLLQGRLFSYVDTQLSRLGGPNYNQIPVNRPHAPVNDMLRDGFHQHAVHEGIAPYKPNSLDGGCPFMIGDAGFGDDGRQAFVDVPQPIEASTKVREAPASFSDHFSQVRQFWISMTPVEQEQIIEAYSFELGKCSRVEIRERQLECLARIDDTLCQRVADNLGLPAPTASEPLPDVAPSPALSIVGRPWPIDGRKVGVIVGHTTEASELDTYAGEVRPLKVVPMVIAANGAPLADGTQPDRTLDTVRSIEFDAFVVAPGGEALLADPRTVRLLDEALRHGKTVLGWGAAGDPLLAQPGLAGQPGVEAVADATTAATRGGELLALHRTWAATPEDPTAA